MMRNLLIFCLIAGSAILANASENYSPQGWQLILQDFRDGLITIDEKAQLALTLLINPESLPSRYRIDQPMKDATTMLIDIMTEKDRVNPRVIDQYFIALNRVTKQKYYDTPEGHFRIHYDTAGTHAVYLPYTDNDPPDGVPDYVNRTAEYFERAWHYQCDTLGYDTPPFDGSSGGGSNLYDVYMHRYSGAYGVTWPENYSNQRPGRNNDMTSYIYVDPAYSGFGYSDRRLPMMVTSAHEFFHAVQCAYNASAGTWFMEHCAVWMEEKMWDDVNDCYDYMYYFFNNPHMALTTFNGSFEYGAFVWPTYIDENYGTEVIRYIWETTISTNAYNAMLAILDGYGSGIAVDYPAFATWNYLTGQRNDGQHYSEGSSYNQVRIMRTHTYYPVNNNTSSQPPNTLGCNYIMFVSGNYTGNLRLQFNGADNMSWAVPVVKSLAVNQHEFDIMEIDSYGDGEILIRNIQNYAAVVIIPCLLYGATSNYTYTATIEPATGVEDDFSNLPDNFALLGNYPNPFNDRTMISFKAPRSYAGYARIEIYDQVGRKVDNLLFEAHGGINNVPIVMGDHSKSASGTYYYKLKIGENEFAGKLTYLK